MKLKWSKPEGRGWSEAQSGDFRLRCFPVVGSDPQQFQVRVYPPIAQTAGAKDTIKKAQASGEQLLRELLGG